MKILPISPFTYSRINNKRYVKKPDMSVNRPERSIVAPYFIPVLSRSNYCYNPVSKTKPNYDALKCKYSDLDSFSELFAQKINSQMYSVDMSDIDILISKIKAKTGADEKIITEVLCQLTMFSNYDAISVFQKLADQYDTNIFGMRNKWIYSEPDISSNAALEYFARNKSFIACSNIYPENSLVILDDIFIRQLENSKHEATDLYTQFVEELKTGHITLLDIKGWNIKCSDGKYRSAAFIYGTGELEALAIDVVNRIKSAEDIDKILYSDNEQKLREILQDDIEQDKIEVVKITCLPKRSAAKEDILKNLSKPKLDEEKVKDIIVKYVNKYGRASIGYKTRAEIIMKYLNEAAVAYSFDSICANLTEIYKSIKEKYGDNIAYLIMDNNKSTNLINHLFAHLSGISVDRFFRIKSDKKVISSIKDKGSTVFILDDISASGQSIKKYSRRILQSNNLADMPVKFVVLTASETALRGYKKHYYRTGEIFCLKRINDIEHYHEGLLKPEEVKMLRDIISLGYAGIGLSVVYPYIIADNCTNISGELFKDLLIQNNSQSNKVMSNI